VEANRQRALWRADPWAPGATIVLSQHEELALEAELTRHGHAALSLPPAVLDGLRWKWRRAFMDGQDAPGIWRDVLAALPKKLAAAGSRPPRVCSRQNSEHALYVADAPAIYSKRRRKDAGRTLRRLSDTCAPRAGKAGAGTQDPPMAVRAAKALQTHADALAVILADFPEQGVRRGLALAYDQLRTGESDCWAWLDALAAARRR
jgi:hypothetical protein